MMITSGLEAGRGCVGDGSGGRRRNAETARRDHERIDTVLAGRVKAEEEGGRAEQTRLDRLLAPLNRLSSKRFLKEARQKVWHNVGELHAARVEGDDAYRARLAELEVLSAARIADLLAPGQVLLRSRGSRIRRRASAALS
jgi:hypothetical protein